MTWASCPVATRQEGVGQRESYFRPRLTSSIVPSGAVFCRASRAASVVGTGLYDFSTFSAPCNIHGDQIVILDDACLSLSVEGVGRTLQ